MHGLWFRHKDVPGKPLKQIRRMEESTVGVNDSCVLVNIFDCLSAFLIYLCEWPTNISVCLSLRCKKQRSMNHWPTSESSLIKLQCSNKFLTGLYRHNLNWSVRIAWINTFDTVTLRENYVSSVLTLFAGSFLFFVMLKKSNQLQQGV